MGENHSILAKNNLLGFDEIRYISVAIDTASVESTTNPMNTSSRDKIQREKGSIHGDERNDFHEAKYGYRNEIA